MAVMVVTPPAVEPVSLADAKLHSRVDSTSEDTLFTVFITSARTHGETITHRAFVTQTLQLSLDGFPLDVRGKRFAPNVFFPASLSPRWGTPGAKIELPRPPFSSLTSVVYDDANGVQQTLDPATYVVKNLSDSVPAYIVPVVGAAWPATSPLPGSVRLQYVAGWDPASVPPAIRAWMLVRISSLYSQREKYITDTTRDRVVVLDRDFCDALLDAFTVPEVA